MGWWGYAKRQEFLLGVEVYPSSDFEGSPRPCPAARELLSLAQASRDKNLPLFTRLEGLPRSGYEGSLRPRPGLEGSPQPRSGFEGLPRLPHRALLSFPHPRHFVEWAATPMGKQPLLNHVLRLLSYLFRSSRSSHAQFRSLPFCLMLAKKPRAGGRGFHAPACGPPCSHAAPTSQLEGASLAGRNARGGRKGLSRYRLPTTQLPSTSSDWRTDEGRDVLRGSFRRCFPSSAHAASSMGRICWHPSSSWARRFPKMLHHLNIRSCDGRCTVFFLRLLFFIPALWISCQRSRTLNRVGQPILGARLREAPSLASP